MATYGSTENTGYPKTASELWQKMFVDYFRHPGRTLFLGLDGVDEIGGREGSAAKELLNLLLDLPSKCSVYAETTG